MLSPKTGGGRGWHIQGDPDTLADLASRLRMHQAVAESCMLKIENMRGVNEMLNEHYQRHMELF